MLSLSFLFLCLSLSLSLDTSHFPSFLLALLSFLQLLLIFFLMLLLFFLLFHYNFFQYIHSSRIIFTLLSLLLLDSGVFTLPHTLPIPATHLRKMMDQAREWNHAVQRVEAW